MVLDTSAIVSIVLKEPGYELIAQRVHGAEVVILSAPAALETAIVLSSKLKRDSRPLLTELFRKMNVEIVDFTEIHFEAAVSAFLRFGKGRHPAALNFGDCMSYALAKVSGLPLLYSGADFARTDVQSA